MRKGKTVIGQDVFSLRDGVKVDTVSDLVIDDDNDSIVALLVDEGGLMASSKVIPVEAVTRFGPSAVMVADSSVVVEADDVPGIKGILDREATLLQRRVLTTDGDDLGAISDMYFDEASGRIRGFEVSGGRLGDALNGSSYLPHDRIDVVGPDAVITGDDAKGFLEEQRGGLTGAVDEARKRAGEIQSEVQGVAEEAGDRDGTLVGRRAASDVTDRSGSIIVANGQRIELDHVRAAREAGAIDELYAAAGAKRQRSADEQARETADDVARSASDLWDRFTAKLSDLTDEAGRRIDAEQTRSRLNRINDAIGRPVTKAILDRDDNVILDVGDLVTHKAIQRAHDNGMLDSLLDSIYVAEMTFARDELRARVEGDATVGQASGGAAVVQELEHHRDELERDGVDRDEQEPRSADAGGPRMTGFERRPEDSPAPSGR